MSRVWIVRSPGVDVKQMMHERILEPAVGQRYEI